MKKDPYIVSPTMSTLRAIELMREYGVGCLPVVADGRLVGLVTGDDFMGIAGQLLEERLRRPDDGAWAPWEDAHPVTTERIAALGGPCPDPAAR